LFELLELYKREIGRMPFIFQFHSKFIDDEVAAALADAGAVLGGGAIETCNMELKERVLKRHDTPEDIVAAVGILKKHNIRTSMCSIFGIPTETREQRWETVELADRCQPDIVASHIMYPYPGTDIVELAMKAGVLSEEGFEKAKMGLSSSHQYSLLQNPDIDNAETMAKLLPLYVKSPRLTKPLLRRLMEMSIPNLAHFIYVASAPLLYSGITREWMVDLVRRFILHNLGGATKKK
jgi:anaerobic magnesium-protoporphyrin IX monomethyl ester cyclase